MKFFSQTCSFGYDWRDVVAAFWQRYPSPYSKHVLSEDVTERHVDGDLMWTRRLLIKTNRMPKWAERITHARSVLVVEDSCLDRGTRRLVTYTRNVGYSTLLCIRERCVYSAGAGSPTSASTLLAREAIIRSQMRGLAAVLERFGLERFKHNANNAADGIRFVLTRHLGLTEQELAPTVPVMSAAGGTQTKETKAAGESSAKLLAEARNARLKLKEAAAAAKAVNYQ